MGDNPLDRVARIKLSIGSVERGRSEGEFYEPRSLAFDHHRGLLLVVDCYNHRVQLVSYEDYDSFVSEFGREGSQPGYFYYPYGLAIDHDLDRILVVDSGRNRVQSFSLSDQSFLSCVGEYGSRVHFNCPQGIAIDKHHRRVIIADSNNNRLVFLSSIDLSFLFSIGKRVARPGVFNSPSDVAIDHARHRIIVSDTYNHRVQVLSLTDGSFLFKFGSQGDQPGQFNRPLGVCVDNHGRIIVADYLNFRLQAFTYEGHHISFFDCGCAKPYGVAFDEHRGLIAFSAGNQVHVIGVYEWLADTKFVWLPERHRYAPSWIKHAVLTMTMIRSLVDESSMSMIPNELLFEIFSHLEAPECTTRDQAREKSSKACAMV